LLFKTMTFDPIVTQFLSHLSRISKGESSSAPASRANSFKRLFSKYKAKK